MPKRIVAELSFPDRNALRRYCLETGMRSDTHWILTDTGLRGTGPICKPRRKDRLREKNEGELPPDKFMDRSAPDGRSERAKEASLALDNANFEDYPVIEALQKPEINALFNIAKEEMYDIDREVDDIFEELKAAELFNDLTEERKMELSKRMFDIHIGKRKRLLNTLCIGRSSVVPVSTFSFTVDCGLDLRSRNCVYEADRFLSCFVRRDILSNVRIKITDDMHGDRRSHFSALEKEIRANEGDTAVFVHEMGHAIEHFNPNVSYRCKEFLSDRTWMEKPVKLEELFQGNGYDDDEIAIPDNFMDSYVGKIYKSHGTEILSMGLEYLFTKPIEFLERDEEHFRFVIAVLRGVI